MKEIRSGDLPGLCETLGQRIDQTHFVPTLIVYVERAGRGVAEQLSVRYQVPSHGVEASRLLGGVKRRMAWLLARLPRSVVDLLRSAEIRSGVHQRFSNRRVRGCEGVALAHHRILVVDDAVDSGETMRQVLAHLVRLGARREQVRTAVIALTRVDPLVAPDFKVFDEKCRFPWSSDWSSGRVASVLGPSPDSQQR